MPRSKKSTSLPSWGPTEEPIRYIPHPSLEQPDAAEQFGKDESPSEGSKTGYMIDDETRAFARRMHYAAYRLHHAKTASDARRWRERYYRLRDDIVLGNQKLIFRVVRRWNAVSLCSDDLIGECYIVLIRAVVVYNPWLGVRFSTYAWTCLARALSRLTQRWSGDRLRRALPIDSLVEDYHETPELTTDASPAIRSLNELLRDDHPLLSSREKTILRLRYSTEDTSSPYTLAAVGGELGLSKERVRQLQSSAIDKLRKALTVEVPGAEK